MKTRLFTIAFLFISFITQAQSTAEQLQKANSLYKQFKEEEALNVYKQILAADSNNMEALLKCTELSSSIGAKQADKNSKAVYFIAAKEYADKALTINGNSAEANYAQALAYANLSQIETENKKTVEDVRQIKVYADKGMAVNPNHALLNYMEGKWHYELLALNWFKKTALKAFYGNGLAKPDIDSAIYYMEKCRTLEPYFVQNYLDLAKAYNLKDRPTQAIEVLTKMVKLPNRTAADASLKEEGKKMLQGLQ